MGAMITVEYDDRVVLDAEVQSLAEGIRAIVVERTAIKDTFVYVNSAHIKVAVSAIEIFVQVNARKNLDLDELVEEAAADLAEWKHSHGFQHPINLTFIPAQWHFKLGI